MLSINIYVPENLNKKLDLTARLQRRTKAAVIRDALEKGLEKPKGEKSPSAQALLDLAKMAEKLKGSGPRDLSINHDYYTWGGKKRSLK